MLRTLLRVLFGFVLACLMAGIVTVMFATPPGELLSLPSDVFPQKAAETIDLALLTATHSAIFAFAFTLIAAGLAEWLSIRTLPYYLLVGIAIAMLGFFAQYSSEVAGQLTVLNNYALKTFLTAGFFAGIVYWLAAGQFAGRAPDDEVDGSGAEAKRPRIIVEDAPRTGLAGSATARTEPAAPLAGSASAASGSGRPGGSLLSRLAKPDLLKPATDRISAGSSAAAAKVAAAVNELKATTKAGAEVAAQGARDAAREAARSAASTVAKPTSGPAPSPSPGPSTSVPTTKPAPKPDPAPKPGDGNGNGNGEKA